MTRQKLAIFFAAALMALYIYEIFSAYVGDSAINSLNFLGLGLAFGLLVTELRSPKNN